MLVADDVNQFEYQAQRTFSADETLATTDENVEPIFLKNEMSWKFDRNTRINNLVVSNGVLILHLNEKTIQRRCPEESKDTKSSSTFQDVQITDPINKIFLDPYGRVVLVSTREKRDVYVLLSLPNSLKLIKKPIRFGNTGQFTLASVSWCNQFIKQGNDVVALLAGQDGSVYEIMIRADGEVSFCNEVYPHFKTIIAGNRDSVTGIYCDVKSAYEDNTNIFAVVTTQKALYYFENQIDPSRKSDYFTSFFASFRDASLSDLKYREFPGGDIQSEIQLFTKRKSSTSQLLNRQFAWITAAGLYYTEIDPVNVQESFLEHRRVIDYHFNEAIKRKDGEIPPKSVALTEFHCLMMFPNENQIRGVCTVNEKLVMIDGSMISGRPVCYARDQVRDQLWACTDERVLVYSIKDERRDVWRVFMQKKDFLRATETCIIAGDNAETIRRQRLIHSRYADYLFDEKKYSHSANIYATSDTSFEDVTLKLFALKEKEPLQVYLQAVLQYQNPQTDKTQITILTLWLTDLFLNEIDELRNTDKWNDARRKFQYFLRKPEIQSCLREHSSAMYDLLTSHGDLDDLILFAEHVKDYERVILLYLERQDFNKALKTIEPLDNYQLLYKYSPILIEKVPDNLVNIWKAKYNEHFDAKELLPSMIAYSRAYPKGKIILDFLKFCLSRGCVDKSIHNYLLSEYVKFDHSQIMPYLRHQRENQFEITYDPRFALRLCIENNLKEECVFLYRLLNMLEEAVDTALQVNVKLAKDCALAAPANDERTKKLWLKIASSAVAQKQDLNEVMEMIEDIGNDLLKIEDILPLFPDFETIDQFKKPIIKSLEHYNHRLNDLRNEMNDASKSIDNIRDDLAKYRTRCIAMIDSHEMCSLCNQTLMLQSTFYVFSCGHYFHGDCLYSYVRHLMKRDKDNNINENISSSTTDKTVQKNDKESMKSNQLKHIDTVNRLQSILASGIAPPSRDMESVQQELDELVASQCVLCGEMAIDSIDQPLDSIL